MDKIVIEYNEMEQLYVDYVSMETKISECIQNVSDLGAAFKNTFVIGISSEHLTDMENEKNSIVGFARITIKLQSLLMLVTMIRLHIENTTTVMEDLDNKINEMIISSIASEYGITNEQAREAFNNYNNENNAALKEETGMDDDQLRNLSVQSTIASNTSTTPSDKWRGSVSDELNVNTPKNAKAPDINVSKPNQGGE